MNVVENPLALPKWTQSTGEELANTISHGIGVAGAIIGTPILLVAAFRHGSVSFVIGTIVFTVTMLLLYLGSMLYHAWPQTPTKSILQVLDHSAIFLLIAGTYTPFALGPLRGAWGWTMLGLIWALAALGVWVKATRGSVSGNGLAGPHLYPPACARRSAFRGALAAGRRNRLHGRRVVLREERRALFSFCVASVRTYRYGLSFYRSAYLRCLT
jgi:Haemolysin-III related